MVIADNTKFVVMSAASRHIIETDNQHSPPARVARGPSG